jgi:pyrroline-5-carboxylate reductase
MSALTGKRFGFLGAGVIAEVFVRRLLGSGLAKPDEILAYDIKRPILERLATTFGVRAVESNSEVVSGSHFVFLAMPPTALIPVLREVAPALRSDQIVLSSAAAPVAQTKRSSNSLNLMIGTRTLDEAAARGLFTQAVGDAHAMIMATEAKVAVGAAAES